MLIKGSWWKSVDNGSNRDSKTNDWRCGHWWENGYVRRLEMPKDTDWKNIQAFIYNDIFLEIKMPKIQKVSHHAQVSI